MFGLSDINELPISYDIAWYEQKAVAVLLVLLSLGVKGIRLGLTLPAFLSPNVAKVLVDHFNIKPIGTVEEDIAAMMAGIIDQHATVTTRRVHPCLSGGNKVNFFRLPCTNLKKRNIPYADTWKSLDHGDGRHAA